MTHRVVRLRSSVVLLAGAVVAALLTATSASGQVEPRFRSVSATSSTASDDVVAGETVRVSTTLRNDGTKPVTGVTLRLDVPQGWDADAVGPADSQRIGPGGSFTASWDVTPPVSAEPGAVAMTGTASYRHRGESFVVLPTSASLGVVPAVEATAIRVPAPLLGGVPGQATVVVSWEQFTLDGGPAGRNADLRIFNDEGNFWRFNALVVQQR